eukprot:TRINITY_DN9455_c0_g1_i1.p1 TRINITY_DN9455_c0_g1~~TRINITY_DN9455_c0_g1_i1.p1  ORF type:complete len:258 (+),score=11.98 TRINITY_DN9455_c0_g1_i1:74-847(+)
MTIKALCLLLWASWVALGSGCPEIVDCDSGELSRLEEFCEDGTVILDDEGIIEIGNVLIPGDLKLGKGSTLSMLGAALVVCGHIHLYNGSEIEITDGELEVAGEFLLNGSYLYLTNTSATVEGEMRLDQYSKLALDKQSHLNVLDCMDLGQAQFSLILYSTDIMAVTGVIVNASFTHATIFVYPLNYTCTGGALFQSVSVSMPAYSCTNVTGRGSYFLNFLEVTVEIGIGAQSCRSLGSLLLPAPIILLFVLLFTWT